MQVPVNIRRSADVSVEISKKHLKVSCKASPGKLTEVVNGDLTWDIKKDESMWSLVPGEHVLVCMFST
jgi:CS domain